MDREGDEDALALRTALIDLSRTLDSLRERLESGERERRRSDPAEPAADAVRERNAQALGIVRELLSTPAELQPEEVFERALERASRLLAAERAMLLLADADRRRLVARATRGFRREDLGAFSVHPGEGVVGRAFEERRLRVYPEADDVRDAVIDRLGVREAVAVPVHLDDMAAGVLLVGRQRRGPPPSDGDRLVLLAIADRVAKALASRAETDRRSRRAGYLADFRSYVERLLFARSPDDALAEACAMGCRLANASAAAIAIEVGPDELEIRATSGSLLAAHRGTIVSARAGLTAELYAGNEFVACRDVRTRPIPERTFLADGGFHGCLLVPLGRGTEASGVLYLADTSVRDFSEEEIGAARLLAQLAASARLGHGAAAAAPAEDASIREHSARIERLRALGDMAGGMTRELNNVFAVILGKSRLVLARALDEPLREGLTALEEAAWRGADVVHRLAAMVTPIPDEAAGPVDLVALVRDLVAESRSRWKRDSESGGSGIDVVADVQPGPPVRGSESVLRDVLTSLVLNAVEAMSGDGRLTLATRPVDDGMEVVIEDTGGGIADEARQRVFDPFYTTRAPKHLGLGLTVAESVILRYGGRIDLSPARRPRRGTRVSVWLPEDRTPARPPTDAAQRDVAGDARREGPRPPLDHAPTIDPTGVKSPGPETKAHGESDDASLLPASTVVSILVLEDEESVRESLVQTLTGAGHRVEAVPDAHTGLMKLEAESYDVVLTDLALPERSGLAVASAVKRLRPRTPVILITGWGHVLDPDRLREHGVDLMLVKPFRGDRALSLVSQALVLRNAAR